MRGLKLFVWLLIFSLLLILAQPVYAASITVGGGCTLIDAITAANTDTATGACTAGAGADTITLTADVTLTAVNNTTTGANGLPSITSNITIEGGGFTIARSGSATDFRIFYVSGGGDLTVDNLTVSGGSAVGSTNLDKSGGGISSSGSLTITNSRIVNNNAAYAGGGIDNSQGTLTVIGSTITNNSALGPGGGISSDRGTVIITNSIITSNFSGASAGGINNYQGSVTITNSTISDNTCTLVAGGGGGISSSGSLIITNSTFSGNSCQSGGGIDTIGTLIITNSTISDNTAFADMGGGIKSYSVTITNSTISGNTASTNGGGMWIESGTATITNNTVTGNSAANGGGIYRNSGVTVNIGDSIVAGNSAATGPDISGTVVSQDYNLIQDITGATITGTTTNNIYGIDPLLGSLADNGGPTQTHALLLGSNAINASSGGTSSDQRGAAAVGVRDIGAYEFDGLVPQVSFTIDNSTIYETTGLAVATVTVTVSDYGANPIDVSFLFSGVADSSDYTITGSTDLTFSANGSQSFTITAIDDATTEGIEALILEAFLVGAADIISTNPQTINISDTVVATQPTSEPDESSPNIDIFDPAISKLGFLVPGQVGVTGEQLEWIITVSNPSNVVGQNIVITDDIDPRLQIDSVNAPTAIVNISGQTVTTTFATLGAGETVTFSIFTTVLDGVEVNNTACVNATNQGAEECFTGLAIAELPVTGDSPLARYRILLAAGGLILLSAGVLFWGHREG